MFGFGDNNDDQPKNPILAGFSRPVEWVKNFVKETFGGAAKGALIGAIALPVIKVAALLAIPVVGPWIGLAGVGAAYTGVGSGLLAGGIISSALSGAMVGAGLGAVIKGGMAINDGSEAVDAAEQKLLFGAQRKAQMAANAAMVQKNLDVARGMTAQPQMAAMVQPQMQPQLPMGMGQQPLGYSKG